MTAIICSQTEATEIQYILLLLIKYKNKQHFIGILPIQKELVKIFYFSQRKKNENHVTSSWTIDDYKNRLCRAASLIKSSKDFNNKNLMLLKRLNRDELLEYYREILEVLALLDKQKINISYENEIAYVATLGLSQINHSETPDKSIIQDSEISGLLDGQYYTAIDQIPTKKNGGLDEGILLKNLIDSVIYFKHNLSEDPITLDDVSGILSDEKASINAIYSVIHCYLRNSDPLVGVLARVCLYYHLYESTTFDELLTDLIAINNKCYFLLKSKYETIFESTDSNENNVTFGLARVIVHTICFLTNSDYSLVGTAEQRLIKMDLTRSSRSFLTKVAALLQLSRQMGISPQQITTKKIAVDDISPVIQSFINGESQELLIGTIVGIKDENLSLLIAEISKYGETCQIVKIGGNYYVRCQKQNINTVYTMEQAG